MRLFKRFWGEGAAKAAPRAPQEVTQPPEDISPTSLAKIQDTSPQRSESSEDALWRLYGRAILIEVCRKPETFGLDGEKADLLEFYSVARGLQRNFWEDLQLADGNIQIATDPAQAVWKIAAKLTELDWTMRGRRENG